MLMKDLTHAHENFAYGELRDYKLDPSVKSILCDGAGARSRPWACQILLAKNRGIHHGGLLG
jgi:hypothetical protein